jgi:hypothetical protein
MRRLSLLAFVLAAPAFAQPPGVGSADVARTVAPFIDEHTLVVGRVDVARVDVETVLKLAALVSGEVEDAGEMAGAVRGLVKRFTEAGGKDVLLTYGSGDFPNLPCLIVPAPDDPANQKAIGELLAGLYARADTKAEWVSLHGCVCVGTRDALAVLKARKPVARPELTAAREAGRDGVAQAAVALSAEAKKIHEQVAPTLPTELGGGGIQKLTRGVKWMAVVIGPGPKMPAKWITECASPDAARDLKEVEQRALQAAAGLLPGDESDPRRKHGPGPFDQTTTTQEGSRLTTEWDLATSLTAALKRPEGTPAERMRSANNLKQLLLALHNYHDTYGHFPTDVRDKDGKPLLSWRVQILPFIEANELHQQFKLDEPWDSEHNKKLVARMPKVFRSPRQAAAQKDRTTYLAPLGKGLMWDEPKGLKIGQIADGTSNTIALVEADDDRAVVWSKPEDITIDPKNPATGLLGHYGDGFQAAMADGSVRFFKKGIEPMNLWALFTRAGGEVVDGK